MCLPAEMGEPDAAEEDLLPGTPARQMILEEPKAQEEPHKKGTKAKKKKKKQYVPLPTLEAREDELSFSISFTQRLGRHAVARRKIEAGVQQAGHLITCELLPPLAALISFLSTRR